jgi:hypothetical protein
MLPAWKGFNPEKFEPTKGVTPEAVNADNAQRLWTLA